MSEQRPHSGETPGKVRSLSARDAVGLTLLALGAFLSVSVSTDWLRGGDGGGANRSTTLVVGLLGLLGPAPLFAVGAAAAALGAWLFGSRRTVGAVPLALGALALVLAAPFAAAFVSPGSGGALGDLAAPADAATGLRVLALALFLILGAAGTYACFAAFGRAHTLLGLVSGSVSRAKAAVNQGGANAPTAAVTAAPVRGTAKKGADVPAAKAPDAGSKGPAHKSAAPAQPKVSKDDGQQRIEGAHPGGTVRAAGGAVELPRSEPAGAKSGAAGAHLAARPQGGAAEAAAGTSAARPFVAGAAGAVPARPEKELAPELNAPREEERGKPKEITLLVGGKPVERGGPQVDYAEGAVGAVRPVGGVRPLGTTPAPEEQPATIAHGGTADVARPLGTTAEPVAPLAAIAHTQRTESARPLGTAPAPNPALGIAPLPLGAVGGAKARDIGTAPAPEFTAPVDEAPIAHPAASGDRSRAVLDPSGSLERGAVEAAFSEALTAPAIDEEEDVEEEEFEEEEEAELDEYEEELDEDEEDEEEEEDEEYAELDEEEDSDEEADEDADELEEDEEDEEYEESEDELEAYAEDDSEDDSEDEEEADEDEDVEAEAEADETEDDFDEVDEVAASDDEVDADEVAEDDSELADDEGPEIVPHARAEEAAPAASAAPAAIQHAASPPAARAARRAGRRELEPLPQPDLFDEGEPTLADTTTRDVVLTPVRAPAAEAAHSEDAESQDSGTAGASRRSRRKKPTPAAAVELAEDERERLIHEAGLLFLEEGRVAVSLLQKRYSLDFQRSTEILDALQERGLIGPYLGGQRRDILMDKATWEAAQTAR